MSATRDPEHRFFLVALNHGFMTLVMNRYDSIVALPKENSMSSSRGLRGSTQQLSVLRLRGAAEPIWKTASQNVCAVRRRFPRR